MPKQKVVIFEGVDKSGKTTLKELFNKKTNYKYWVLDRSFVSSLVYSKLFNRNDEEYWMKVAKDFCDTYDVSFVYCYAPVYIVRNRLEQANEVLPKELQDISQVSSLFVHYLTELHQGYIVINTECGLEICLRDIINLIGD